MIRLIKAFLYDSVSWMLLLILGGTLIYGLIALFGRYDRLDHYETLMFQLERDIHYLELEFEQKQDWVKRLEADPTAWEQVGREKMNYLAPDEVLVRFTSK